MNWPEHPEFALPALCELTRDWRWCLSYGGARLEHLSRSAVFNTRRTFITEDGNIIIGFDNVRVPGPLRVDAVLLLDARGVVLQVTPAPHDLREGDTLTIDLTHLEP